jgi:hypothetical protein
MASTRQRDGRWTGLYRDREGHQRSGGTYSTKSAALKAAKASEAIEAAGADARQVLRNPEMLYSSEKKGKPTVAGYAPQWLSGHRLEPTSRATYQAQLKHIVSGLGNVTLASLSAQQVRAFIRQMEAGRLSSSTTGLIVTTLREMCKTAVDDGLMARDVTSGIKIAGRHARELRILSPSEYRAVLAATPVHYKLLVEMAVASGMRWGEQMGPPGRRCHPERQRVHRPGPAGHDRGGRQDIVAWVRQVARRDQAGHGRPRPRREAHRSRPA